MFYFQVPGAAQVPWSWLSTGPPAEQRPLAGLPLSGRVGQCPGASSARSMKIDPSTSWDAGLSLVDTTGLLCLLIFTM